MFPPSTIDGTGSRPSAMSRLVMSNPPDPITSSIFNATMSDRRMGPSSLLTAWSQNPSGGLGRPSGHAFPQNGYLSSDLSRANPDLISALCHPPIFHDMALLRPATASFEPLLFPNRAALVASAERELSNELRHRMMMSDAYQRGREQVLQSLIRSTVNPAVTCPPSNLALISKTELKEDSGLREGVEEEALASIGASNLCRRKKKVPYFDASALSDPDPTAVANRRTRGGVTEPFPEKLHRMLTDVEKSGRSDILSFFAHGRAFGVHKPESFVLEIMPQYFKQSRLSSFQRQLNLYGFTRITSGPDTGGYYHELFLKGRPALCVHMRRVGVPQACKGDRRLTKVPQASNEPDFYSMAPIVGHSKPSDNRQKSNMERKSKGMKGSVSL